ncbi:Os11g0451051, partial [Oryza sativa Japonica Group]
FAKQASEWGVVLRQHIPIFTHWKEYKNGKSQLKNYMDKVVGQFAKDENNQTVKDACADLLKSRQ